MRIIVFLFICSSAFAGPYDEFMEMYRKLPNAQQMTLLEKTVDKVSRHFDYSSRSTAVIYCISGDIDVFVITNSVAGCIDKEGNKYYFWSEGLPLFPGSTIGASVNIFAAVLHSKKSSEISGVYKGTQYGFSVFMGPNYGHYARSNGNGLRDYDPEEKLRLEGITFSLGPSIDLSAGLIKIGRF